MIIDRSAATDSRKKEGTRPNGKKTKKKTKQPHKKRHKKKGRK
jgi:hypothetical protein